MRHNHWLWWLYHHYCPPCRVRRLRYGYRLEPVQQREFWFETANEPRFTSSERLWIAGQVRPCEIDYD